MRFFFIIFIVLISCNSMKKNNPVEIDRIELKDGSSIKCKSLSKQDFDKRVTQYNIQPIAEYKTKYSIDVFEISKQEVLVLESNYYTLYYSLSDLDAVLNGSNVVEDGREILYGKNPYGVDFPKNTEKLINQLGLLLHLQSVKNLSPNYLEEINKKINALDNPQVFFEGKFINIVALIGEAIREREHASWDMKLSDDKITWNPYLKINNQNVNFFSFLYEDIFIENNTKNCIPEIYQTAIGIIEHNLKY